MTTAKTSGAARSTAAPTVAGRIKKVAANGADHGAAGAPVTPAAPPNAAVRAGAAAAEEAAKPKHKLVRDSFTIPKSEYAVLDALKLRAARLMRPTKKSEVLRAGIAALHAMGDKAFLSAINGVPSLKTGRPKATPPATKPATK